MAIKRAVLASPDLRLPLTDPRLGPAVTVFANRARQAEWRWADAHWPAFSGVPGAIVSDFVHPRNRRAAGRADLARLGRT